MSISTRICAQCQTPIAAGHKYCGNCGTFSGETTPSGSTAPRGHNADSQASATISKDQLSSSPIWSRPASATRETPKLRLMVAGIGLLLLVLLGGALVLIIFPLKNMNDNEQATAIVTPAEAILTPTLSPPLFFEDFTSTQKQWNLEHGVGYSSTIKQHHLLLTEANHKVFREKLPGATSYKDFMVDVTFTFLEGDQNDSVGLYLRGAKDDRQGYYVDIYGDNTYDISKVYTNSKHTNEAKTITGLEHSSVLYSKGQPNKLTIIMKGPKIVLSINGTVVKSVTDSDYINGPISLFVENGETSDGTEVSFESIAIYPAPDRLPVVTGE